MQTFIVRIQDGGSDLRGVVERPGDTPTTFRTSGELLAALGAELAAQAGPSADQVEPGNALGSTSSSSIREQ